MSSLLKSTPKITGGIQTRGSFIDHRAANIREITFGINFEEKLTLGMGYHWLKTARIKNITIGNQAVETQLKMRYFSMNIVYTFHQRNHWYFSLPIEFGIGKTFREGDAKERYFANNIVLYEPVMLAEYRVFKYFGVAGGIGFRLMLKNNKFIDEQFSSPVYVARLKVRFGEIYNDLK